jgi:hypothetical protein
MQLIDKEELTTLVENSEGRCVSLFMPMTREPDKQDENRIRLKNLIKEARTRLTAQDANLRVADVQRLLQPAEELLENGRVWVDDGVGLAVFLAPNFTQSYTLPLDFEELVVVGKRFHIKPLLPLFSRNNRFYILALSQNEVRLFRATPYSIDEVELETLPTSMAEVLRYEDPEKQLQHHTSRKVSGATNQRGAPVFHGHEVGSEKKDAIRRYFREVDAGLQNLLANEEAPLVLAAVSYLIPIYRDANTYSHVLEKGIPGNPEEVKPEELQQRAWEVVQPLFAEAQSEAAERYRQLANSDQASNDVAEIVPAAYYGRVDTLFTSLNRQQWGTFNRETGEVTLHVEPGPDDRDLLDVAAVRTFLNGGTVYAVDADEIPGGAILSALFRY